MIRIRDLLQRFDFYISYTGSILLHLCLILFLAWMFYAKKNLETTYPIDFVDIVTPPKKIAEPLEKSISQPKIKKHPQKVGKYDSAESEDVNSQSMLENITKSNNSSVQKSLAYNPSGNYIMPNLENQSQNESIPEEVRKMLIEKPARKTKNENLNFMLSNYQWSFQTYVEQWARIIQEWWKPPLDYISGKHLNGGSLWVAVTINKSGDLINFKINRSDVSTEMDLKAIRALISSFKLPELPSDFPGEVTFYWQFIYPSLNNNFMKK